MAVIEDAMLTTYDNPFNPFEEFEQWFKFDMIHGHDCCGRLARLCGTSVNVLSDEINEDDADKAMDEIIKDEPTIYLKVTKESFKQRQKELKESNENKSN